jgi:hypothetical protein
MPDMGIPIWAHVQDGKKARIACLFAFLQEA